MRFLADENVHPVVVTRLRAAGVALEWVAETGSGCADEAILSRPDIGEIVLITYDRDFGDLIFNKGYPTPLAILYSRLGRVEPRYVADRILALIERGVAERHMTVITRDEERLRPFPLGESNG